MAEITDTILNSIESERKELEQELRRSDRSVEQSREYLRLQREMTIRKVEIPTDHVVDWESVKQKVI